MKEPRKVALTFVLGLVLGATACMSANTYEDQAIAGASVGAAVGAVPLMQDYGQCENYCYNERNACFARGRRDCDAAYDLCKANCDRQF
jgi:hypothetical protein